MRAGHLDFSTYPLQVVEARKKEIPPPERAPWEGISMSTAGRRGAGEGLAALVHGLEGRAVMPVEMRGVELGKLPVRNAAGRASILIPFVPKPANGSAVPGVPHDEALIAMRGDANMLSVDALQRFDAMENTRSRRPKLDFINDAEQIDLLAIIPLFRIIIVDSSHRRQHPTSLTAMAIMAATPSCSGSWTTCRLQ